MCHNDYNKEWLKWPTLSRVWVRKILVHHWWKYNGVQSCGKSLQRFFKKIKLHMNQQTYNLVYIQSTWNHFFSNRWQYWRVIAVLFTKQHIISQKLSGTRWMDNDMLSFLFNFKNNSIYNFFLSAILMTDSYDEISSWDQSTQAFITRNIFFAFYFDTWYQ